MLIGTTSLTLPQPGFRLVECGAADEQAVMAGEIVERIVQGEAVVPQDDVPLFPAYAAGELGLGHVFVEKIDEGPAFLWRPVGEARGEHAVEVDSFRTRIRVAAPS